tara:strand:- start:6005 stop:6619 length:615 start_codon:yes stop_codon:yes gene_type:complete
MAKPPKKSKRFEYNLESALNFRELRETQEQDKFNKAEQKYNEELNKEERMKDQEKSEHAGLLGQIDAGQTIDFQQVMMRKSHLEQLKTEIVEQVEVRETAEQEKDTQRETLVQAMKDKKILEEDKEKKRDMWKKIMKKEEMKFLDEIASISFTKKLREEQEEQLRRKKVKADARRESDALLEADVLQDNEASLTDDIPLQLEDD